jgi:hypothetical protein
MSGLEVIAKVGSIEARGLLSSPLRQLCDVGSDLPRLIAAVAPELRSLTSWAINCGLACCQEAALLAEVVDGANLL